MKAKQSNVPTQRSEGCGAKDEPSTAVKPGVECILDSKARNHQARLGDVTIGSLSGHSASGTAARLGVCPTRSGARRGQCHHHDGAARMTAVPVVSILYLNRVRKVQWQLQCQCTGRTASAPSGSDSGSTSGSANASSATLLTSFLVARASAPSGRRRPAPLPLSLRCHGNLRLPVAATSRAWHPACQWAFLSHWQWL
jgi:hypothetical protein